MALTLDKVPEFTWMAQSRRDDHVVTPEVSPWGCVLGERQVSY
jgi:hypothetical protein